MGNIDAAEEPTNRRLRRTGEHRARPQQVNNCSQVGAVNETSESSFVQNKLLDDDNGKWLDSGEAGATGSADQGMATVGVLDGTQDRGSAKP